MRLGTGLVVVLVGGLAIHKLMACVLPHGCTEVGCADNVFVEATFSDAEWPIGAYRMELQFDDTLRVCSFGIPADLPAVDAVSSVSCEPRDPQLAVNIGPTIRCMEEREGGGVTQSCERLPGRYTMQISTAGTPGRMQLRLERDGELVSEHDKRLTYAVSRPNGPDCEPLCRQSSFELRLD